jgi:hypothetical protein
VEQTGTRSVLQLYCHLVPGFSNGNHSSDVNKLPIDQKEKTRKLYRLGKMFGVIPPLEMVFPPSPTSRSRFDPKRYTLELPPPLIRGTLTDDLNEEHLQPADFDAECEDAMRVDWDTVNDEASRRKVMNVLRQLRN